MEKKYVVVCGQGEAAREVVGYTHYLSRYWLSPQTIIGENVKVKQINGATTWREFPTLNASVELFSLEEATALMKAAQVEEKKARAAWKKENKELVARGHDWCLSRKDPEERRIFLLKESNIPSCVKIINPSDIIKEEDLEDYVLEKRQVRTEKLSAERAALADEM